MIVLKEKEKLVNTILYINISRQDPCCTSRR